MEPVPVIVQAVLVDEPNKHLIKSAKLIGMSYLTYYAYLFSNLIMDDKSDYIDWAVNLLCAYVFAIWLPVYGITAAKKNNDRALSVFSCLQTFLCIWFILQIIFEWSMRAIIINICTECEKTFSMGNTTCTITDLNNKMYEINYTKCRRDIPSMDQVVTSVLQVLLALSSFMGTIYVRKKKSMKIVSIVSHDVPDIEADLTQEETTVMAEPEIVTETTAIVEPGIITQ